ncbi:MAG: GNAT family N-acetyltransferase [Chloroflexi bacterium]|nr:GNAT family N-acetyltransferase [Chloroflexota bacterium]
MTLQHSVCRFGEPMALRIESLTPGVADSLRLPLLSRFTNSTLRSHVAAYPGLSWVILGERAYIVGGRWRLRQEIGEIVELSHGRYRSELLQRALAGFRASGTSLVVLDYEEQDADLNFYRDHRFGRIERVVEYERSDLGSLELPRQEAIRPYEWTDFDTVLDVEREAFPWLWWNSADELKRYISGPNVSALLDVDDDVGNGKVTGYASFTVRGTSGYLDRLAVRELQQGQGIGTALLLASLWEMRRIGARRVGLSTQETNARSRTLYERHGFHRTLRSYDIYGLWLKK